MKNGFSIYSISENGNLRGMTETIAKPPRLYALDGLRGICALLIMFYHYNAWTGADYFQIGSFGVYLFFVLSGFSLWYVYARSEFTAMSFRAFFVARFARIFPLYMLVNARHLLMKITHVSVTKENFASFLLNSSFLFGVADPGRTSGVTGGWSIGIEWVFYLMFPLCWVFWRRMQVMWTMLLFALVLNQLFMVVMLADNTLARQWFNVVQFPVFLVYFIAGIVCAELYLRHRDAFVARSQRAAVAWGARAAVLVCLAVIFLYPSATVEAYHVGWHFPLLIAAAMIALWSALLINPGKAERATYGFIGEISFGTYLLHPLLFTSFAKLFTKYPDVPPLVSVLVAAGCTVVLAYVLYRLYEMPARRWINRRYGGGNA